jgi:hypothetical protein
MLFTIFPRFLIRFECCPKSFGKELCIVIGKTNVFNDVILAIVYTIDVIEVVGGQQTADKPHFL